ncbi:putative presenilin-like protein-like [Capsicum annuum]|nr:putative presenilin-like protein-like [Capsicum annuum]
MSSVLRTPSTTLTPPPSTTVRAAVVYSSVKPNCISFLSHQHYGRRQTPLLTKRCRILQKGNSIVRLKNRSVEKFVVFGSNEDVAEAETETKVKEEVQELEQESYSVPVAGGRWPASREISRASAPRPWFNTNGNKLLENLDGAAAEEASDEHADAAAEETLSVVSNSLQLYRDALANNDDSKVAEIETTLKSIEDEKIELQTKVASLTEELSNERDRVLRISADFDNFRKRTDRERASLVTNAQGEVVEKLLSVLDNFERAKMQIKVTTEGEEKINNSYQSISKQFLEILGSLGVEPVETVGKPFDPLLHEAIMREDSSEFEEGVVLEEYRKGFRLGDRLLRPSMVKVSAGPGPAKPETAEPKEEEQNEVDEKSEEGNAETPGDEGTSEEGN